MFKFSEKQISQYNQMAIQNTGILAFRDLERFVVENNVDLHKVLDLGCGSGRSTNFLNSFCEKVSGCDISESAVKNASSNKLLKDNFFFVNNGVGLYEHGPYTSIFSILMFFHLSEEGEIETVFKNSFNSLDKGGHLVIVCGTENLYKKDYLSISVVDDLDSPLSNGQRINIELLGLEQPIQDYYWKKDFVVELAKRSGFEFIDTCEPIGSISDNPNFKDEVNYPPYYYLLLKKP